MFKVHYVTGCEPYRSKFLPTPSRSTMSNSQDCRPLSTTAWQLLSRSRFLNNSVINL
ncbi:hypothetical protein M378DRAFT_169647 [Amanita muscaria Koide BX008]|uniref:Uncharacterized protein n=1 Tax=Amanita muscaria (strain Koide BX008) TaxID=946122 RepID=A0A0C2WCV0_AMAMK|nr:hypothetical protein M378DRAFT_169647 [Amanita muscaria Koide BX008]